MKRGNLTWAQTFSILSISRGSETMKLIEQIDHCYSAHLSDLSEGIDTFTLFCVNWSGIFNLKIIL